MNAVSLPPEEVRFAQNTSIMTAAVYDSILTLYQAGYQTVQPELVAFVSNIINKFDPKFLIEGFIINSHFNCWDSIKRRNEHFFIENAGEIFKYLPVDKVNLFKDLFTTVDAYGSSVVSQDTKDELWDLFDVMVKIAIKYVHKNRAPYSSLNKDGTSTNYYECSFFDEVDIVHHAKVWGLKLEFPVRT